MLTFFYSTQTCSTAVHIALEEAGIPFKGVEVSWKRKVNVAELEAVNPLGQVPALVDNGKMLNQTIAILEHISDQVPQKNLLPSQGIEHIEAISWLAFIGADFQRAFTPLVRASRWTTDVNAIAHIRKAAADGIEKHLLHIEKSLNGKEYILGKGFTLADAYLFTILGWCKWAEVKTSPHVNISAYLKRIYARPAVQKVLKAEEMLEFFPG